jgi:hypothetical protein
MEQKALIYFKVEVKLWPTASRPVYLGATLASWAQDQIFVFCLTNEGFLDVERPLWREDGSLIYSYNCFWSLPEQSLSCSSPAELTAIFYCLISDSPTWRARSPYSYPAGTGWLSYTPGHCLPFPSPLKGSQGYSVGILTRLRLNLLWSSVNCTNIYLVCPSRKQISSPLQRTIGYCW